MIRPQILVTGAHGQLGKEVKRLFEQNTSSPLIEEANILYTDAGELDITDIDSFGKFNSAFAPDIIINCAAYTAVDLAEEQESLCYAINSKGPANLAEYARVNNALLVHVSTDYVFNGQGCVPYNERDVRAPLGVYGKSKAQGEQFIEKSGAHYVIIRTSWLYSAHGKNFFKTIHNLSLTRDSLNVVFDQTGTPTLAADLASAVIAVCVRYVQHLSQLHDADSTEQAEGGFPYGIYHYSNEGVCSWYDFAVEIADLAGSNCNIIPVTSDKFPAKSPRPSFSVMDKTKIKEKFGLTIPHWRKSLMDFYKDLNIKEL